VIEVKQSTPTQDIPPKNILRNVLASGVPLRNWDLPFPESHLMPHMGGLVKCNLPGHYDKGGLPSQMGSPILSLSG
jgi:hypothetical protein